MDYTSEINKVEGNYKMTASEKTIASILKDLTNVHENLLSLSNDIWASIEHNDNDEVEKGCKFQKEFNNLIDEFCKNKDNISALLSQFSGIKIDEQPKIIVKNTTENQRLIKELNQNEPHEITEDFTFKRPVAFIFNGCAYPDTNNWTELYVQFAATAAKLNPTKIKEMAELPDLISKQNRKYYSSDKKDIRKPAKIMNDFFVETNLCANDIAKRIIEIINQLGMKTSDITIYLRQDRNA